jgi:probable rRNA maturation factor
MTEVYVGDEQDGVPIDPARWLRLCADVLAAEGIAGNVEMSLLFVDEPSIAAYNEQYMGKHGPTDVLSFPIDDEELPVGGRYPDGGGRGPGDFTDAADEDDIPRLLGDVLICPPVAAANAAEHAGPNHDGSIDDELALLVVHGILHLLSYDHAVDEEAEAMEQRERELLHKFYRPASSEALNTPSETTK